MATIQIWPLLIAHKWHLSPYFNNWLWASSRAARICCVVFSQINMVPQFCCLSHDKKREYIKYPDLWQPSMNISVVPVAFSPLVDIDTSMFLSAVPDISILTFIALEFSDPRKVIDENWIISTVKHTKFIDWWTTDQNCMCYTVLINCMTVLFDSYTTVTLIRKIEPCT